MPKVRPLVAPLLFEGSTPLLCWCTALAYACAAVCKGVGAEAPALVCRAFIEVPCKLTQLLRLHGWSDMQQQDAHAMQLEQHQQQQRCLICRKSWQDIMFSWQKQHGQLLCTRHNADLAHAQQPQALPSPTSSQPNSTTVKRQGGKDRHKKPTCHNTTMPCAAQRRQTNNT